VKIYIDNTDSMNAFMNDEEEKPPSKNLQNGTPNGRSLPYPKKNPSQPLSGKKLLVVNTGNRKKKFIFDRLKKLGFQVICLNKEKNWADKLIEEWIIADTYNHNLAISAAAEYFKKK